MLAVHDSEGPEAAIGRQRVGPDFFSLHTKLVIERNSLYRLNM